jgi:hypothetical protein
MIFCTSIAARDGLRSKDLMQTIGKMLPGSGVICLISGVMLILLERIPFRGQLPGDTHIEWSNVTCHFPVASSMLLNIPATMVVSQVPWPSGK